MSPILKTLLACVLGLGFLFLEAKAKPTLAFLGLNPDAQPMIYKKVENQIQKKLAADTALMIFPAEDIAMLFSKGILKSTEINSMDLPNLSKALGAQYFIFGSLEPVNFVTLRAKWKRWALKTTWSQSMQLRILEAASGKVIFDGPVATKVEEKGFINAPDPWEKLSSLERDHYLQKMSSLLAVESANQIAKVIKEKSAPGGADSSASKTSNDPGSKPASP